MTLSQLFVLIPYFYITLKHTSLVTVYRIQIKFHVFVLFFMSTTKKLYIIPLHHSQTLHSVALWNLRLVYHTFLHHSQTKLVIKGLKEKLVYHTFLHHSQTMVFIIITVCRLVYHTFLHHSQTEEDKQKAKGGLCTIHFYIILKPQIQKWNAITCIKSDTQTIYFNKFHIYLYL